MGMDVDPVDIIWLVVSANPSEKYEFVSWDYYSEYMESHNFYVPNHQLDTNVYHNMGC